MCTELLDHVWKASLSKLRQKNHPSGLCEAQKCIQIAYSPTQVHKADQVNLASIYTSQAA